MHCSGAQKANTGKVKLRINGLPDRVECAKYPPSDGCLICLPLSFLNSCFLFLCQVVREAPKESANVDGATQLFSQL